VKKFALSLAIAIAAGTPFVAQAASSQRIADVAERGKDVMPFDLTATTHIFTKTAYGGTQRLVVKRASDTSQVKLVRQHLKEIRSEFSHGDFSGPMHTHGTEMPGLAQLRSAKPGQVVIQYKEVAGGAELTYKSTEPVLVAALHKWFDAQLSDHGPDAMEGHEHHDHGAMPMR